MKMKHVILGTIVAWSVAALSSTAARAGQQYLFSVGSEFKKGWTPVSVAFDDGSKQLTGLYVDRDFYSSKEIREGAVIRIDGVDNSKKPLKLKGESVSDTTGGKLNLAYLFDGRGDGTYKNLGLELRKTGETTWTMHLPGDDRIISSLFLTENTTWGFTIGVKNVKLTFKKPEPKPVSVASR